MKNVYVKPEVEYINFYSEETITTSDDWTYTSDNEFIDKTGDGNTPTLSLVDKGGWI